MLEKEFLLDLDFITIPSIAKTPNERSKAMVVPDINLKGDVENMLRIPDICNKINIFY
mgnify:CR=1 FL=1